MTDFTHVTTERLDLRAVAATDLAEQYALHADPRLWRHLPSGVYTDVSRMEHDLERYAADWEAGLGYWTLRRREDDAFVGIGGVRLVDGRVWNVYYRIAVEHQGHGYATEVVRAALDAAAEVGPDVPVVAYLLDHNAASRRTAERCGLREVWRGPDEEVPGGTRLVFADRDLPESALAVTT